MMSTTAQRLREIEATLDRIDGHLDYMDGAATRVAEAQAADATDAQARDWHTVAVREVAGPAVGKALGDAIFGQPTTVRESTHPLGPVSSGPHSHGSVRHEHAYLPGSHLHCPQCGSDSRLCAESPHTEPGPVPAREANSNPWIEGVERVFDGVPSRPVRWEDYEAFEQAGQQARAAANAKRPARQASAEDRRLVDAFERSCTGLGPTVH